MVVFFIDRPCIRGHDQEKDDGRPEKQARKNINDRHILRVLSVAGRYDDIVILHLAVGQDVFQLSLFRLPFAAAACVCLDDRLIPERLRVIPVYLQYLIDCLSRFLVILPRNAENGQKQLRLHIIRLRLHHLNQLKDR